MNWLGENALVIWMLGAIALTMALIVYFQTRANGALFGVLGVLAIFGGLLLANFLIETPREAVERTLYSLAATVEANNVPATLKFLAPSASIELKKDVETLMPQVRIDRARVLGAPEIALNSSNDAATVECRGIIVAVNKRDGMKGGAEDRLRLQWIRQGDRWLLESYSSQKNWNNAVGRPGKRGAQPTP